MSGPDDEGIAGLILLAQANWAAAGCGERLIARVFGRRLRLEHCGFRATVAVWRGAPFLVSFREMRA